MGYFFCANSVINGDDFIPIKVLCYGIEVLSTVVTYGDNEFCRFRLLLYKDGFDKDIA